MINFSSRPKKSVNSFFHSYLFLLIVIIVAIMISFSYIRTYYRNYQIKNEIEQLQKQAKDLEVQKFNLLEKLDYVKSSDFVEQKAKTDLGMVKPGEKVIIVEQASSSDSSSNGQADLGVVKLNNVNNYHKWWDLFMKN